MAQLSQEQMDECRRLFALYDVNNDGHISSRELGSALRGLGIGITEEGVRHLVQDVDRNKNGQLEFSEFAELYQRSLRDALTEEKLIATLAAFDRNNTGTLEVAELKHILTTEGEPLAEAEIEEIFREAGVAGPNFRYREFAQFLRTRY